MDHEPEEFGFERYCDLVAERLGGWWWRSTMSSSRPPKTC